VFSGGLYLALAGVCASNLRVTPLGPTIWSEGGWPFLYEIGIAVVALATLLRRTGGIPCLSRRQKAALAGMALFYAPIFLNYILKSRDRTQFVGGGELRLQMEVWLLGICVIIYPVSERTIRRALLVVVIGALANGLYVIAASQGIVEPMYRGAWRAGEVRNSGFFFKPSRIGVISAVAIAWSLSFSRRLPFAMLVLVISGFALILSDSRTGMVAALAVVAARILSGRKISSSGVVVVAHFVLFLVVASLAVFLDTIWGITSQGGRLWHMRAGFLIWMENPFGVPWGTFDLYKPYMAVRAVSPHNWVAVALLYGGVFSFFAVLLAHIGLLATWWSHRADRDNKTRFRAGLILILIALTVGAWFEQLLQQALATLIYIVAFGALAHEWDAATCRVTD
jgi:hypothetical protein